MQAFQVLLLTLTVPLVTASTAFESLERVEVWLIERRLNDNQDPICRASVPDLEPGSRHGFIWILTT